MPFLQYSNIENINVKKREIKCKPIAKNVNTDKTNILKYYNCVWKEAAAATRLN